MHEKVIEKPKRQGIAGQARNDGGNDHYRKSLIKKFHVLLGQLGLGSEAKEAILAGFGAEYTTELNVGQLTSAICALEKQADAAGVDLRFRMSVGGSANANELDKSRKRLIAAIGGWLTSMGMQQNIEKNKAIAVRAAKRSKFNDIPLEQLRSLYGAFTKKKKDLLNVAEITEEVIEYLKWNN